MKIGRPLMSNRNRFSPLAGSASTGSNVANPKGRTTAVYHPAVDKKADLETMEMGNTVGSGPPEIGLLQQGFDLESVAARFCGAARNLLP